MTINGHSLAEIGAMLKEPFDPSYFLKRDNDGAYYLPTARFKERFDRVVGIMNYDYELKSVSRHESVAAAGSKPLIEVQITITIKDDDGVPVKKCEGIGVATAIIVSATGKEKNANGDVVIAEQAAFKHLCQNVFDMANDQLAAMNEKNKQQEKNQQTTMNAPKGVIYEKLVIKTPFVKRGMNLYADAKGASVDGDVVIVIFGKDIASITARMPEEKFIATYTEGKEITMNGSYGSYNGKMQFRFNPASEAQ